MVEKKDIRERIGLIIAAIGLVIALIVLLFGNNICEQIVGKSCLSFLQGDRNSSSDGKTDLENQAENFVNLYFQEVADNNLDNAWTMLSLGLQQTLGESNWYKYWGETNFEISNLNTDVQQNTVWVTLDVIAINKENLSRTDYPDSNFCVEYNGLLQTWKIKDLYFSNHKCW